MPWRVFLVYFLGVILTFSVSRFYFQNIIFEGIIVRIIAAVVMVVWIAIIRQDFKQYKLRPNRVQFIPTVTCCFFLLLNVGVAAFINYRMESPTLLFAGYYQDFNGFSIDFKKNGRCILSSDCLGSRYTHTKYTLSGNIITLEKLDDDGILKTKNLKIFTSTKEGIDSNVQYITQIDQAGSDIGTLNLRVTEDNRSGKR